MKKHGVHVLLAAVTLVAASLFTVCSASGAGSGSGGDDIKGGNEGGDKLPTSVGKNALSGKIYFETERKIEFLPTAEGAAYGTYKTSVVKYISAHSSAYDLTDGGKYKYREYAIGKYYWNEDEKTARLVPEQVAYMALDETITMCDEAAYWNAARQWRVDLYDEWKAGGNEARAYEELAASGYDTFDELFDAGADYDTARAFRNITNHYAFSSDDVALFLDEKLPPNVGTNELIIGTYTGMTEDWVPPDYDYILEKDPAKVCTFNSNGVYTYYHPTQQEQYRTETGTYSYNSTTKQVWLKYSTAGRNDAYTAQCKDDPNNGHNFQKDYFENVDDYNAAVINSDANRFRFIVVCCDYDMEEGTIWSKDYYIN
jgi:hypothetical protein